MKAEIVLLISKEHTLMSQLCSIFGQDTYMRDFTTIAMNGKYVYIQHIGSGKIIAYTAGNEYPRLRQ